MSKTVGVCIIAKNEEALIGRMLESVKGTSNHKVLARAVWPDYTFSFHDAE